MFVVDETAWRCTERGLDALVPDFEAFADRLDVAREREECVVKSRTLYEIPVVQSFLFEPEQSIHRDLRLRLQKLLDRISDLDETNQYVDEDVSINGGRCPSAISIAWAHRRIRSGQNTACLSLGFAGRRGRLEVTVEQQVAPIWFVVSEAEHVGFFREMILEVKEEAAFIGLVPSAFPQLSFADGVWKGLRRFSRSFVEVRKDLIRHLSVLSDHGQDIFDGKRSEICQRFGSHGIEISPENGQTLANLKCMRARTQSYKGESLLFNWHTKLRPNIDRIHISEGVVASNGKIIVGILCDHLPLPGD